MRVVRIDGVTFVVEFCQSMSKDEFIKTHINSFWTDRDEATRKAMLTEAYAKIKPPKKAK